MRSLNNKTLEFLFPLQIPDDWLAVANRIWNDGLTLLNWRQHYLRLQECLAVDVVNDWGFDLSHPVVIEKIKQGDAYYMHCWIGKDRRIDRSKSWDKDNLEFCPQVRLVPTHWLNAPPIENASYFTLNKQFTKKVGYDSGSLPSGLMQSHVGNLAQSWQSYLKGLRGKPRYRGKANPVTSLSYDGFRNFCKLYPDGRIKLPGMSAVYVHGIKSRLLPLIAQTQQHLQQSPSDRVLARAETHGLEEAAAFYALPGAYSLIRRLDGTYLQISGEFAEHVPAESTSTVEISVGGSVLYQAPNLQIPLPNTDKLEQRITALQQRLAKKQFGSANWKKLRSKISELQRHQKMLKRRHQQYHAQWLTDRHGEITIHKLPPEIKPCPIPRPDGEGNYGPNGATAIAENNRATAKAAIAQFVTILKQQGEARKRVVKEAASQAASDSDIIDNSPATPSADSKSPNLETEHGNSTGDGRKRRGKQATATPIIQTAPRQLKGRNRRKERAIG